MNDSTYRLYTFAERPDRAEEADALCSPAWPEFMLQDPVADRLWHYLLNEFAAYQFFLCDDDDCIVGIGNTIPVGWDIPLETLSNRGWDAVFEAGVRHLKQGVSPTMLSALQAVVVADQKGKGISKELVHGMRFIAQKQGLPYLIAPVRPNWKSHYPLTPMAHYLTWKNADDLPFDPWVRVHARLGAKIVKVAQRSMKITGSIAEWERWTEMYFPESGRYIVTGALNPVTMNLEKDIGTYIEPNVWMVHENL